MRVIRSGRYSFALRVSVAKPSRRSRDIIDGYLSKPEGDGPFPAIVHLHGCNGLPKDFKSGADKGYWSEALAAWGYVVLVVDSFTTRGIEQACADGATSRIADAYGGLAICRVSPLSTRAGSPSWVSRKAASQR